MPGCNMNINLYTYILPVPPNSVGSGEGAIQRTPTGGIRDSPPPVPTSQKRIRARDADETPLDLITVKTLTAHNNDENHTHAYA